MRTLGVLLLCAAAGAGGGCGGDSTPKTPREDPFEAVGERQARPQAPHSAPRWEALGALSESGRAVRAVDVSTRALQWRVQWSCRGDGGLTIRAARKGARPEQIVDAVCPGRGQAFSLQHGRLALRVDAPGPWRVKLAQQIDSPIHEAPLRAMSAPGARVVREGNFYGVERKGKGKVSLFRLANGRLALRFEDFATTTNTDLVVWLSSAPRPRSSREAFRAPYTLVAPLRATIGEQNYLVPRGIPERDLRSVVIWCVPARIAYSAARLQP